MSHYLSVGLATADNHPLKMVVWPISHLPYHTLMQSMSHQSGLANIKVNKFDFSYQDNDQQVQYRGLPRWSGAYEI